MENRHRRPLSCRNSGLLPRPRPRPRPLPRLSLPPGSRLPVPPGSQLPVPPLPPRQLPRSGFQ